MAEQGETPSAASRQRINTPGGMFVRDMPEGTKLRLANNAVVEIVTNAGDGGWVLGRYLEHPTDPDIVGTEDWVFFGDVREEVV